MTDDVKDIIREQIKRCADWSRKVSYVDSAALSRAVADLGMVLVEAEKLDRQTIPDNYGISKQDIEAMPRGIPL